MKCFFGDKKCVEITKYSLESQENGVYTLFYGRCDCFHGYNLATISDIASNFHQDYLIKCLNSGLNENGTRK